MENKELNKALYNLIQSPYHPLYNFILGYNYDQLGQTTSAFSFYLRSAEFSTDNLLSYESLLRGALCIERQGNRVHTLKGMLLRAISLIPDRPEAYFILSRVYEYCKDWNESYTIATIGEKMIDNDKPKLMTDVGYCGSYLCTYQKAIAGWSIGMFDESIHLLRTLNKRSDIIQYYKDPIRNSIAGYGRSYKTPTHYDESYYQELRFKFKGSELIKDNHSQCYQDMFVLSMLNGKRKGSFVEIGCDDAYFNNNTVLLEKTFDWIGISIDIDPVKTEKFSKKRNSEVITADATKIDFKTLLVKDEYDYLQLDCEPASTTFEILKRIPLERVKFAVITFEHDNYCDDNHEIKKLSRKYLQSYGYTLVVTNIAEDNYSDFEDWYVHPDLVDKSIIEKMKNDDDTTKKCDEYMLCKI